LRPIAISAEHTRGVQKLYRRESIFAALEVSKAFKAEKSFPESVSEGVVLYPPDRVDARASQ
jgi:hypothetical protein